MARKKTSLFEESDAPSDEDDTVVFDGNNRSELQTFIDRIRRLEEEKKTISDDISSIIKEAAKKGYDAKALRRSISASKWSTEDRKNFNDMTKRLGLFD